MHGIGTVSVLFFAAKTSSLTPSFQVPRVFGNVTFRGTSATLTAVSTVPLLLLNRQPTAFGKGVRTSSTELP